MGDQEAEEPDEPMYNDEPGFGADLIDTDAEDDHIRHMMQARLGASPGTPVVSEQPPPQPGAPTGAQAPGAPAPAPAGRREASRSPVRKPRATAQGLEENHRQERNTEHGEATGWDCTDRSLRNEYQHGGWGAASWAEGKGGQEQAQL